MLDRPNPAGRPVEGLRLRPGWESFVGAGPLPMRHGLTLGELAQWFVRTFRLDVECEVVTMEGWQPESAPGYGWPLGERAWVNPESQRGESVDGALLRRHRDAGRHDALRGARHDTAARAVRRTGPRSARAHRHDGIARARMDARLPAAGVLVRADVSQARRASSAPASRSTSMTRRTITTRFVPGGWSPSPSRRSGAATGLRTVARLPLRVRTRPARHRSHQRQRAAARMGGRPAATAADLDALAGPDEDAWREAREAVLLYR